MKCNASSIDPTHPGSPTVQIVKEIDFDGLSIPDSTLRVVTYDGQLKPVRYYVTHETELFVSPDNFYSLTIWAYDVGSNDNKQIGKFTWEASSGTGALSSSGMGDVEELVLSSCVLAP
ncbi:MAG: hypothetical protein IPK68_10420 [Bdellovibrionales bacterium]|nr:hypothetical protein [Bdellovibrionales bacterium]